METIIRLATLAQDLLDRTRALDFLALLALRLYLAPIFWIAGMSKVTGFDDIVQWFGNPDWGLGLPAPWLLAFLATASEAFGAVCLLFGFATRWMAIPLMVTMVVAATTVHWGNGWQAVADTRSPFASEYLGPLKLEDAGPALERKEGAIEILKEHGNYAWLSADGRYSFVVLNNGIEWPATYFVMLLALFFMGGGRYLSADYWIAKASRRY